MDFLKLLEKVEQFVEPVLASLDLELIEREFIQDQGRWILRLYIDREDGSISLEDCEKVSRTLGALLDVENMMPGRYVLEVSSPGRNRPLRRSKDFEKYIGERIDLKTITAVEGRSNFHGILKGLENNTEVVLEEMGKEWKIPLKFLKKARLKK